MALGYCPALLMHLKYVAASNAPETKITPAGFTKMLLMDGVQAKPIGDPFELANNQGHIKDLRLKYYQRTTDSQMATDDNCDVDSVPEYSEVTIDSTSVVKFGFHIDDYTIARYCDEASRTVAMGGAPTGFMEEHLAAMMASLPGFVQKIDKTLLSSIVWGKNVVTGANTAQTVNFNDDATINLVSEGFTKLLQDYAMNEGVGTPLVVGSGIINAMMLQAGIPDLSRYSMLNNAAAANQFKFYHDINAAGSLGSNQFGVFMPGTLGMVQLDEYVGFRAGLKGTSTFFNAALPIESNPENGALTTMKVDMQFKYLDCPQEATVGYETVTLKRGWNLIMKKNFALWQLPTDAYQTSDRLTGNNGSLRYTATNS